MKAEEWKNNYKVLTIISFYFEGDTTD